MAEEVDTRMRYARFLERLAPASDEEIIALAEKRWADPALRPVFERVGWHGDFSSSERAAVESTIDAYRQGSLWERDELHLLLAPCLVRQLAEGVLDRLDGPEAKAFLADRRVHRRRWQIDKVPVSVDEIILIAQTMVANQKCWEGLVNWANNPGVLLDEIDDNGAIEGAYHSGVRKYGFFNRDFTLIAIGMAKSVAKGNPHDLEGCPAREYVVAELEFNRRVRR